MEQGSNQLIHIRDIGNDCVGSWCAVLLEVGEDDNICIRKNLSLKGLSVQRCKACLFGFVRKCLTYLNNFMYYTSKSSSVDSRIDSSVLLVKNGKTYLRATSGFIVCSW